MIDKKPQIFFGASTGRTATMTFSNALNGENSCICLHEGKFRHLENSGEKLLDFLTLENRIAYEFPEKALEIVEAKRSEIEATARKSNVGFFGDIAYNNTPFLSALAKQYPSAKFVGFFRNCLSFVSSATVMSGTDETPVGWPPANKPLNNVERFIALGRWQPREDSPEANDWGNWSHRAQNIWLWAETNRHLLSGLRSIGEDRTFSVRFEDFSEEPTANYVLVRAFLGFSGKVPEHIVEMLSKRINHRRERREQLCFSELTSGEQDVFERFAIPIMKELNYG